MKYTAVDRDEVLLKQAAVERSSESILIVPWGDARPSLPIIHKRSIQYTHS